MPDYPRAVSQDDVVDESINKIVADAIDIALLEEVVDGVSVLSKLVEQMSDDV